MIIASVIIFSAVIIYFILIMPGIFCRPDMVKILSGSGLFAHRGLYGSGVKENTAEAFLLAVKNNYGVEFDIRLSSDKIPVVIHDATLLRVFGIDRRVDSMTASELKAAGVPTLYEVLRIIDGKVPIIAEIKADWKDISVCPAAAKLLDIYSGAYCIESFNPLVLLWYKKHRKTVIRGQLSTNFRRDGEKGNRYLYFVLRHLLLNFITSPDFIAYKHTYSSELSLNICRKLYRIPTAAWTVRSAEELNFCRKSYNIFIFENFQPNK
jgi:glycerophosphoryl diester phosphodiesterase